MNKTLLEIVEEENKNLAIALHIKTALTTRSGIVLLQWLKENCFMTETMNMEYIDSIGANQRVNARRDLYIALDNLLQRGINHVSDHDGE